MFKQISFSTKSKVEVINLDDELTKLKLTGNGLLHVFAPHATAGLILNEAEQGLVNDFEKWLAKNFKGKWEHNRIDDNASAHLASGLIGQSVTIPVKNSELIKGTWQNLLFLELDGPRSTRKILFQFLEKTS